MKGNRMNLKAFADLVKAYHDAPGEPGKRLERAILEALCTSEGFPIAFLKGLCILTPGATIISV